MPADQGGWVVVAEYPLPNREQLGELIPHPGRLPRLSSLGSELVPGGQSVQVVSAGCLTPDREQLGELIPHWLEKANSRVARTIRASPASLIEADREAMLPLPAVPPAVGWHRQVRLGRDYYVRLAANDYSAEPAAIGAMVDVRADLDRVQVSAGGRLAADHARVWARGLTVTDPAHLETARRLRREFRRPRQQPGSSDLFRDLADYDRAFGLIAADGQVASWRPAATTR